MALMEAYNIQQWTSNMHMYTGIIIFVDGRSGWI